MPLESVLQSIFPRFEPSSELRDWAIGTLIDGGDFVNPDHEHLKDAHIGFLWTNMENSRQGRIIIGQAEQPAFRCGKWQKGRQEQQICEWFGDIPDFIITLDANYCLDCTDLEFMALVDHELYHCAQAIDKNGQPSFNRDTGLPNWAMRGHDVEEFIGVVERYGVGDPLSNVALMVKAANEKPLLGAAEIAKCCGTCNS